jgi:hypothetical protein
MQRSKIRGFPSPGFHRASSSRKVYRIAGVKFKCLLPFPVGYPELACEVYRVGGFNLNAFSQSPLRTLNWRAIPVEGFLNLPGQGRLAGGHEVDEFFFGSHGQARVLLFLIAQG